MVMKGFLFCRPASSLLSQTVAQLGYKIAELAAVMMRLLLSIAIVYSADGRTTGPPPSEAIINQPPAIRGIHIALSFAPSLRPSMSIHLPSVAATARPT